MVVIHTRATGIEGIRGQVLNIIEFRKFPPIVGGHIALKLFKGLTTEIISVNEKQDSPRVCKFNQAINCRNGGKSLTASGRHLNQGARAVLSKRMFKILNGAHLGRPQPFFDKGRHTPQLMAQR